VPSNWTKQPQFLLAKYFNSGLGDATIGGALSGVPSGVVASQGAQTRPGDRLVLSSADALALSDSAVGTLYGGLYMYVTSKSGSVGTPTRGRLLFWDLAVADSNYQVTPDESGVPGASLIAGIAINTLTKGYSWWILIAGKGYGTYRAVLTGAPAAGQAVYAAAAGAGADLGALDVLDGGGNPTFTQVGLMQNYYMGVAEGLPVAGATSVISIPIRTYRL
jgi:hypothetical protein